MEKINPDQFVKLVVRNRRKVVVTALLYLFIRAMDANIWGNEAGQSIRDRPEARNLPQLRRTAESLEEYRPSRAAYEEIRRRVADNGTYETRAKDINDRMEKFEKNRDKLTVKIERAGRNQKLMLEAQLHTLAVAAVAVQEEARLLAQTMLNEFAIAMHDVNSRNPRVVTLHELGLMNLTGTWLPFALLNVNKDARTKMLNTFLNITHLAGVDGGIPVVPTEQSMYPDLQLVKDHRDLFTISDINTTELQRGEALWIQDFGDKVEKLHQKAESSSLGQIITYVDEAFMVRLHNEARRGLGAAMRAASGEEAQPAATRQASRAATRQASGAVSPTDSGAAKAPEPQAATRDAGMALLDKQLSQLNVDRPTPAASTAQRQQWLDADLQEAIERSLLDLPSEIGPPPTPPTPPTRRRVSLQLMSEPRFRGKSIEQAQAILDEEDDAAEEALPRQSPFHRPGPLRLIPENEAGTLERDDEAENAKKEAELRRGLHEAKLKAAQAKQEAEVASQRLREAQAKAEQRKGNPRVDQKAPRETPEQRAVRMRERYEARREFQVGRMKRILQRILAIGSLDELYRILDTAHIDRDTDVMTLDMDSLMVMREGLDEWYVRDLVFKAIVILDDDERQRIRWFDANREQRSDSPYVNDGAVAERVDYAITNTLLKVDYEEGGPYHGMSSTLASALHHAKYYGQPPS